MIVRKRRSAAGFACLALATVGAIALVLGLLHPAPIVRAQGPQVQVGKPGFPLTSFAPPYYVGGSHQAASSNTAVDQGAVYLPFAVTFGNISVDVTTADGSNASSFGIYTVGGIGVCTTTAATQGSTGAWKLACSQGTVTVPPGLYVFAMASAATTLNIAFGGTTFMPFSSATNSTASSAGQVPSAITAPTSGAILSGYAQPVIFLN